MSLLPPGAAGLITRTVLAGNCCAPAAPERAMQTATVRCERDLMVSTPVTSHRSLRLYARRACDLDPLRDLGLVERLVGFGRVADRIRALAGEIVAHRRVGERLHQRAVDPV